MRGASATDDGNALTTGDGSDGSGDAARGGSTSVVPSRTPAAGTAAKSPGAAQTGAVNNSSQKTISRTAARPITLRNMARQKSAAKPAQGPMQHRAADCELGLHGWGATEAHPDRNHRYPCRKPESSSSSHQAFGHRNASGQGRQTEHAQGIKNTRQKCAPTLQALHQPEQHRRGAKRCQQDDSETSQGPQRRTLRTRPGDEASSNQ